MDIKGAAKAAKNMADRRFKKFEGNIQEVIKLGMFDKETYQLVKDRKRDSEENIVKYEEILTYFEGVYSVKPKKFKAQIPEFTKNFEVMAGRRFTVRTKGKEAVKAIEEEKNKQEQKSLREDRTVTGSQKGGGGGGDKQFKQPTGAHPDRISSEFTPLMAENWQEDMHLFMKTCSNMDILSSSEQKTLMKRFVSTALWAMVELNSADSMEIMVRKVGEAYERQVPLFARKVKFLELMITKGEGYIQWANRINQQAELADMEGIKAQDLQLMKYCQGLHKTDRLYDKLMDMEVKSGATSQEIIKNYVQSQALKADLVESATKNQGHIENKMSGDSGPAPRPAGRSPGEQRKKYDPGSQSLGRDKTKTHPTHRGGQSP